MIEITKSLFLKWNCDLIEINGEEDNIHLLFDAPPQIILANTINNYKTVTSRYIKKEFQQELSQYYWKPYFWSQSYIKKYIEEQGN